MSFSKQMKIEIKSQEKGEDKARMEQEKKARAKIEEEDENARRLEKERLAANEEAINKEIEDKWNQFLANEQVTDAAGEQSLLAEAVRIENERLAFLKDASAGVRTNNSAKVIQSEDVLASKERWIIQRIDVARGTMAKLYKAKDPNQKDLVVKVTPLKGIDPKYASKYKSTYGILRYLIEHPNPHIVHIHEVFATEDKAYVFMDIEQTDLLKKIKAEGPFTEELSYRWGKDIASGLAYLHNIGVAHENLKPDSVLVDGVGRVKIAGLGSAVIFYNPETDTVIMQQGSSKNKFHHHLAPERRLDQPYDPSKADVWSFGCLLVILQTKEWPFLERSAQPMNIQWKLNFKKTKLTMSDMTWNLLSGAFQEDPAQRSNIRQLADMLPSA